MERPKSWVDDPRELPRVADRLERDHASRMKENADVLGLYYARPLPTDLLTLPIDFRHGEQAAYQPWQDLGENLMLEVVDGSLALSVRKLQCKVMPTGSEDQDTTRGCEILGQLIDQVLEESDFNDLALQAARDGHLCDIGPITGTLTEEGEVKWERDDPNCVLWPLDSTPKPLTILREIPVPRENLVARVPEQADAIYKLPFWAPKPIPGVDRFTRRNQRNNNETVRVIDATRVQVGTTPGKRVIATDTFTIDSQDWAFEEHPTIVYRWSWDHVGFGGRSLGSVIAPDHIWVNSFMQAAYRALRGAGPKIVYDPDMVDEGDAMVSDQDYDLIPARGGPASIQVVMPNVVSPELLAQVEMRRQRAFGKAGVNQSLAAGQAPPSLTSGRAQREYISGASARLLPQNRALERLYRDAARVVIMLVAQLFDKRKKVPLRTATGDFIREISYNDVKAILTSKKYKVSFGLVSGLSLDPSGRLQDLKDLSELLPQHVDAGTVAANLDLPDTQALADRLNAQSKLADKYISYALNGDAHAKDPRAPRIEWPSANWGAEGLQSFVRIATQRLHLAELKGFYPAANMAALRKLIAAGKALLEPPPGPPTPAMPPPAVGPGAPMIAPPVTDPTMGVSAPAPAPAPLPGPVM